MLQKNLNVSDIFLWFFQSIFCFTFLCNFFDLYAFTTFTNTTSEPSPQSYHIQTIIPKSYQNQSNLETYVSKFDWFWYDFGMMVWMWYDCGDGSEVVFVNVVNAYKSKKLQRNVKQKIDWKNHKKISLTFKFFCNISPNTATRGFPEDLWRLEKNVFSRDLVCLRVSLCIYWRPWRAKVLFFILSFINNI